MPPIEKKWEDCFGLKFFDRGWRHIKQVLFLNDENHKLGDVTPLELSSLWFANLLTLFFEQHKIFAWT